MVTTTAAPWAELLRYGCGWWVNPDVGAIGGALAEAMSLSAAELGRMGDRGRDLVHDQFSWD